MIFVRTPLRAQPRGPALIDRQNQLGAKVISYFPLSSEVPRGTRGEVVTLASGGTYVATNKGRGLNASGAAGAASLPLDLSGYSAITVACWFYWPAYANTDLLLMEFTANYNNATTGSFIVDPDAADGFFEISFHDSSLSNVYALQDISRALVPAGVWHRLLFTIDHSLSQAVGLVYIDGVAPAQTPTTTYTPGAADVFANDTLYLLSRANASLFAPAGAQIQDLTFYRGVLSAAEASQDYQNPYQILLPRRLFTTDVAPGVSGGAAFVQQSTELFADNASSISPSLAGCTAGNTVVLLVSTGTLSFQYTIPAPAGWSTAIAPLGTASNVYGSSVGIFYKENISAGTQSATVALHGAGTDFASASIIEVSGLAPVNSLGPTASSSADSGATSGTTGTTAAIGARNGMAFVIGHPDGGSGSVSALILPPTGYTDIDNEPSNSTHVCYDYAYKRVTDGAAQSASWSWTSSGLYAAAIAVFYDAPVVTSSLPSLGTGIYQPPMAGLF